MEDKKHLTLAQLCSKPKQEGSESGEEEAAQDEEEEASASLADLDLLNWQGLKKDKEFIRFFVFHVSVGFFATVSDQLVCLCCR